MVAVIGAALEKGNMDGVRHGVDVFETLLILVSWHVIIISGAQ